MFSPTLTTATCWLGCRAVLLMQTMLPHSALLMRPAGPSVGQHDNLDFLSPLFANEDGAWLGLPQAALMGKVEGRDTILLVQLGG